MSGPWEDYAPPSGPTPKEKQTEASTASSQASAASSAASAKRTETLTPIEARTGMAQAIKAEAEAANAQQTAKQTEEAKQQAKVGKVQDLGNLLGNINQARENIGFWSMGLPGQVTQGVWGTPARDLSAALKGVKAPIVLEKLREAKSQSATGASGFGALSERELGLLESAIASVDQEQSQEQLMENLNRVEYHFRRAQAYINGIDPDTPEGAFAAGLAPAATDETVQGAEAVPGERVANPELAGINSTITSMIKGGRSEAQIREWLNQVQPGLGDKTKFIDENIRFWKEGGEPNVDIERQFIPAEGAGKAAVEAALSPPGAVATGFTSGYTSGYMDELTGNQARANALMQRSREENPMLYALGEGAGSIAQYATGAKLLGPLLARYGLQSSPLLGNVTQSTLYGSGDAQPGNRLEGAFTGGVTGLLGTKAVEGVTKGAGTLISGVSNAATRELSRRGVPMTAGQIVGGALKRTEDRLAGLPIVGDAITKRRQESLGGFNRAAFNEALAPLQVTVDDIGVAGVAKAQELVNQGYKQALDGLVLQGDQPFIDNVFSVALPKVQAIPRVGDELAGQVDDIVKTHMDPNTGMLSGESLQVAIRELRELRNSYKTDPQFGSRIAPRLVAVEDAFEDLIRRQAPERAELFKNANEAYKRVEIVGDAVDFAPAANGGVFTPDQLYRKSREVTRRYSGKRASRRGDKPFEGLTAAGRTELPSTVPDSGTAGRVIIPLAAGASLGGGTFAAGESGRKEGEERDLMTPATMAAIGAFAAAAPYSRASQRGIQTLLTAGRPQAMQTLGDLAQKYAPQIGTAFRPSAAGMGISDVPDPEVEKRYGLQTPSELYWSPNGGY